MFQRSGLAKKIMYANTGFQAKGTVTEIGCCSKRRKREAERKLQGGDILSKGVKRVLLDTEENNIVGAICERNTFRKNCQHCSYYLELDLCIDKKLSEN